MKKTSIIFAALFLLLSFIALAQQADIKNNSVEINLTFFYSKTCPHCYKEELFLDKIQEKYPELIIQRYEISEEGVVDKLMGMAQEYGFKPRGIPVTFVDTDYFVGFDSDETTGKKIEEAIVKCIDKKKKQCEVSDKRIIHLPFIGEVDTRAISLPIFTLTVAGLDSFNPCAMWVLTFLLTLLLYGRSRKKMLVIGGIFVFTSAIIYFLFMTAWLNFFLLVGYISFVRVLVAIIAITAGLINIKDLFWFKKGVSLSIDDKHKPKLYEKMRRIVHERETSIAIAGTITLAVFVNFIELLCTAGLPAIYTNILTLNKLHWLQYYLYLILYNVIYVVPLMIIVGVFVLTMGRHKFTESQGKILKLISGLLMLALGIIMLIKPELLSFI